MSASSFETLLSRLSRFLGLASCRRTPGDLAPMRGTLAHVKDACERSFEWHHRMMSIGVGWFVVS